MRRNWAAVVLMLLSASAASCSVDPETAKRQYVAEGDGYLRNGNKAEARSTLQHVLKLNPAFQAADDVRRVLATIEG